MRIRSLAMISTCKASGMFEMRWSPSTFSWSCLKPPGFDLKEVSVVSPLVEEAVVQFTLENPNYLSDVLIALRHFLSCAFNLIASEHRRFTKRAHPSCFIRSDCPIKGSKKDQKSFFKKNRTLEYQSALG